MTSSPPRVGRVRRNSRADIVTGAIAAVLVCLIAVAVVAGWPPLRAVDFAGAARGERSGVLYGWWAPLWATVSAVLGPVTLRVAAAVVLVWALFRRRSAAAAPAVFVAGTILLGGVVPVAVKALVRRPRPEQALVDALDSSFPSAHAFGIATAVLALLAMLAGRVGVRAWRAAALAGAGAVAVICVARVALAVHYVSDVAAGVCLAVVWVVAARLAWRALARRVSASSAAPG